MIRLNYLHQYVIIFFCMMLSACGGKIVKKYDFTNRAPVIQYGASDGYGSAGVHTVLKGETLQTIARYYNINAQDVAITNNLSVDTQLAKGMRLILPPPETYRVRPGDTIGLIARTFDIPADSIVATNGSTIRAGQNIRLPRMALQSQNSSALLQKTTISAPFEPILQSPTAFKPKTNRDPIQVASLGPVHIPPSSAQNEWGNSPITPRQKPNFISKYGHPQKEMSITPTSWSVNPGPIGRGGFSRPVQGPIVSTYGPKSGGLYNEGVNIAAPKGSPVRAAKDGTVVYVGNGVDGYGHLVLLKHADGYITAYAHMEKTLVQDHQQIRQGQVIGTVGTTGNVSRAQLHFEIRKGRSSVNPVGMI